MQCLIIKERLCVWLYESKVISRDISVNTGYITAKNPINWYAIPILIEVPASVNRISGVCFFCNGL